MKTIRSTIFILLFVLLPILNIGATTPAKQFIKTPFTGIDTNLGYSGGSVIIEDGKLIIKDQIAHCKDDTSDPRVSGDFVGVINCVLNIETGAGPCFGSFQITNGGGKWNGSWKGYLNSDYSITIHQWGTGSGGYTGLAANWTYVRMYPDPMSPMAITGVIFENK